MDSVHDGDDAAEQPSAASRSTARGLEVVGSPRPGWLATDLAAELDLVRPRGPLPPDVERYMARSRIHAVFREPLPLVELTDHPFSATLAWEWTWEWPGAPDDEEEQCRVAFRLALRAAGWSEDAIENVWLHPYRYDMLEYLRWRDSERCRAWEANMQLAAEQVTPARGRLGAAEMESRKRRFKIRDVDADESDDLLREVLKLTDQESLDARSIGKRLGPRVGASDIEPATIRSWRREGRRMRKEGLI